MGDGRWKEREGREKGRGDGLCGRDLYGRGVPHPHYRRARGMGSILPTTLAYPAACVPAAPSLFISALVCLSSNVCVPAPNTLHSSGHSWCRLRLLSRPSSFVSERTSYYEKLRIDLHHDYCYSSSSLSLFYENSAY